MRHRANILFHCMYKNVINETRRYAGHSKWQNIKHTKQEQDQARSKLFASLISRMTLAAKEVGEPDPKYNSRLANLIDEAKKANMPLSTINAFLNRIKNPQQGNQPHVISIRTNSGCILLLYIVSNNMIALKMNINAVCKKHNAKTIDLPVWMFDCGSYITAIKDCNLDQATEDAIEADAEDVQEFKDNDKTYYTFKGEFLFPDKTKSQLMNLGYSIISIEHTCIPETVVELSDEELEQVNKLKSKLSELNGIEKIEDNIA